MASLRQTERGPFRPDQIRSGDPYELSDGHAIHCMTTGGRGSRANLVGGAVLDSDPAVEEAGVDTGYTPSAQTLRAPDVAVGNVPDAPGWVEGAPPLAVEYADTGQNEQDLRTKIAQLLEAGTQVVWVVRLSGPRRVEVHRSGEDTRLVRAGEELTAPGILRNPVPVEALYDRDAAHRVTFRNLLQRQGYRDLGEVRSEGREEGREEGQLEALRGAVLDVLEARGLELDVAARKAVSSCKDAETLRRWLTRAATAASSAEALLEQ